MRQAPVYGPNPCRGGFPVVRRPAVCLDGPRRGETFVFDWFEPVMDRKDGRVLYWQPEPRADVPPHYVMMTYGVLEWAGRKALR